MEARSDKAGTRGKANKASQTSKGQEVIKFKIEGVDHLTSRLAQVKESVRNKWLRRAVDKASRIARKAIRGHIVTGGKNWKATGLYKKSIAVKIKNYGEGRIIGIVGPDRSFKQIIGVRKLEGGKSGPGDPIIHRPANIAHLVEYGHGGPSPAGGTGAFRKGWDASARPALAAIRDTLEQGLVKELH